MNFTDVLYIFSIFGIYNVYKFVIPPIVKQNIKTKMTNVGFDIGFNALVLTSKIMDYYSHVKKYDLFNLNTKQMPTESKTEYYNLSFHVIEDRNVKLIKVFDKNLKETDTDSFSSEELDCRVVTDEDSDSNDTDKMTGDDNNKVSEDDTDECSSNMSDDQDDIPRRLYYTPSDKYLSIIAKFDDNEYDIMEELLPFLIKENILSSDFFIWFLEFFHDISIDNKPFELTTVDKDVNIEQIDSPFVISL